MYLLYHVVLLFTARSVTIVDHVKLNKHIFEIFSPFQFFRPKGGADTPTGTPLMGASNARAV